MSVPAKRIAPVFFLPALMCSWMPAQQAPPVNRPAAGVARVPVVAAGTPQDKDPIIVAAGGYWRQHATRMMPLASMISAKAATQAVAEKDRVLTVRYAAEQTTILPGRTDGPPRGWAAPDFDDSGWLVAQGAFVTDKQEIGLLCRRGRFTVNDPAGVKKLTLQAGYRGGVVVSLNGQEVLRASLPVGELAAETPADDYPEEAFFVATGNRKGQVLHWYTDRDLKDQFALRERSLGPVEIPVDKLRRGVNVLAVEIHASNYPYACRKPGIGQWSAMGLTGLLLRASAQPGALVPANARPAGFGVWNADVTDEILDLSYTPPCEPLGPIRLAGARNGGFTGAVMVGSTAPIVGLAAKAGPLKSTDGKAAIPPEAVQVRYGLLSEETMEHDGGSVYGGPNGVGLGVAFRRFEGLTEKPPAEVKVRRQTDRLAPSVRAALGVPAEPVPGAVMPVFVTVDVPKDAAVGVYKGELAITSQDQKPTVVPVELEVAAWTLPEVKDYVSQLSIYQSPDTLAARYQVPLWSPRHWELIEKSVRLIGGVGNHTIIIPLLSKEQVGNEESYVRWVSQPDGSFKCDTTVMDKYLDLYLKHHDPKQIKAVCLVVWGNAGVAAGNPYEKDKYDQRGLPKQTRGQFTVTAVDAARLNSPKSAGRTSDLPVPPVGDEKYEAFWRPVLLEVQANLKKRGLADRLMLGMPADPPVPAPAVAAFRNILPEAGWFLGNHPGGSTLSYDRTDPKKTVPFLHVERVYTSPIPDPAVKRQFGWQTVNMVLAFNRYGFGPLCLFPTPSVWAFRILTETDLAAGHRGPGRIGADYWRMPGVKGDSGSGGTFYCRYPQSAIGQTGMGANCPDLLFAGPDGPLTSIRFENLRESTQSAEAVIFIEQALLAKKLPPDQEKACWQLIDERINALREHTLGLGRAGWQERDRRLYRTAAEVAGEGK